MILDRISDIRSNPAFKTILDIRPYVGYLDFLARVNVQDFLIPDRKQDIPSIPAFRVIPDIEHHNTQKDEITG